MDTLKLNNSLLTALNINKSDRVLIVKENGIADANFIISNLMRQYFMDDNNGVCLVILHNTIGHYQNIAKRLEYDVLKKISDGCCHVIEPLKSMVDEICSTENDAIYYTDHKDTTCKSLFLDIKGKLDVLLQNKSGEVYLVIDDISHLLDLGIELRYLINLINYCINLDERVHFLIATHTSGGQDAALSKALCYVSDVVVDVSPLKTGRSFDVTGVITISRQDAKGCGDSVYHYKALDREIRTFRPGESLKYLLR